MTEFKDFALVVAALVGCAVAWIKVWQTERKQRHDAKKGQVEIVNELLGNKPCKHRAFLTAAQKEKGISVLLGVDVSPSEIPLLIDYYDEGFASLSDIATAWPLRQTDERQMTFRLSGRSKARLYLTRAGALLLLLFGFLGVFVASIERSTSPGDAIETLIYGIFFFGASIWIIHDLQPHIIAEYLEKKERQERGKESDD